MMLDIEFASVTSNTSNGSIQMITDECGVLVSMDKNAPANKAINKLKSRGFVWIVLPRHYLLTGEWECDIIPRREGKVPTVPESISSLSNVWEWVDERMEECRQVLTSM